MNKSINKISFLESIMWLVVTISIVSVATLILGVFKPILVLLGSLLFLATLCFIKGVIFNVELKKDRVLPILLLLLVTSFFRIDQEQYIMGGQDEGVYVNMSKYFENHGQVFPKDDFRESLSEELKTIYDKNNLRIETREHVKVDGKREGLYLPGVYIKDVANSDYVFQFYHLHPLWMAIFGYTFGEDNRQYSLLFFALLSVILVYLIVENTTKNRFYSFAGALLLAVNPLHAYFTKFPVTEVMALCFSLAGFYFLLLYYKSFTEVGEKINRYLVLSALTFGAMFFIRVHGFMYMPFFYVLFLLTLISNISIKKELICYFLGIFALYALSVWYGFVYSYPYVTDIYYHSFSRALGANWQRTILGLIIVMIVFPFILSRVSALKIVAEKLKEYLLKYFYIIFLLVLVVGLYKIYKLGFTDKYSGDPWLDSRWHIAGDVIKAFLYSSFVVLIEHISFVLFPVFLFGLKFYNRKNKYLNILVLFIFGFWIYSLVLQWVVPYQYYYARYLLSELIPYIFLFTVVFLASMQRQKLAKALLVVSIVYFISLTSLQLKGTESKGAYESLNKINRIVAHDDLLLVGEVNYPLELKTTLKYYYDLNVFSILPNELEKAVELYSQNHGGDIYYLVQAQANINKDFAEKVKSVNISIESSNYQRNSSPFVKYEANGRYYNLYRIDVKKIFLARQIEEGLVYKQNGITGTLVDFHSDFLWTKQNAKITDLNFNTKDNTYLQLATRGYNPNRADIQKLNLQLKANGEQLIFIKYSDNSYYFKLPKDIEAIQDIEISSNTFNPKKMGMNNDSRDLGIDIEEIKLLSELPK